MSQLTDSIREELVVRSLDGAVPKLHPHGFIQLDLAGDGSRRLHVWDDDVPRRADPNTVHDHVWDFTSIILRGTLFNNACDAVWDSHGDWVLWRASEVKHDGERGGKVLLPTSSRAFLRNWRQTKLFPRGTYFFPAFSFHDNMATGLTATLFQKGKSYPTMAPCILCKEGCDPDREFLEDRFDSDAPLVELSWMWDKLFAAVTP